MDVIVEYASQIIDISGAMLDHPHGLTDTHLGFVEVVHQKALDFANAYIQYQNAPVRQLRTYLSHDAISPLSILIGYVDLILTDEVEHSQEAYLEALREIHAYADIIREELAMLLDQVWSFMQEVGIPK